MGINILVEFFVVFGLLSGCKASISPAHLDRSNELVGQEKDGIRKDIKRYIDDMNLPSDLKKAAFQNARANQLIMKVNLENMAAVKNVAWEVSRAAVCISRNMDQHPQYPKIDKKIDAANFNTKKRALKNISFSKKLSGTSSVLPDRKDACD